MLESTLCQTKHICVQDLAQRPSVQPLEKCQIIKTVINLWYNKIIYSSTKKGKYIYIPSVRLNNITYLVSGKSGTRKAKPSKS